MVAFALVVGLLAGCDAPERALDTADILDAEVASAQRGTGWAVGDVAPDFALLDQHGQPTSLYRHQGQVVVLELFAAWCASCQQAAPGLEALWHAHRGDGLAILSLMVEGPEGPVGHEDVAAWAEQYGLQRPVLDADEASLLLEPDSFPTYIVLDRQMVIRYPDLWPLDEAYLEALLAQ